MVIGAYWLGPIRVLDWHAHWRHLANTVERVWAAAMSRSAAKGGDVSCFQITFGRPNLVL